MPWTKKAIDNEKGEFLTYLTTQEFARFLNVSLKTIKRWEQSGRLPEPAQRSKSGWGLYSPDQVTAILRERIS